MDLIKINGMKGLFGSLMVQGSKNAALPVISATVMVKGKCRLYNCPDLSDTRAAAAILEFLGAEVLREKDCLVIDATEIENKPLDSALMGKLRSSVIFAGAIAARFGEGIIGMPGGCELGPRPVDMHLKAFEKLNISAKCDGGYIKLSGRKRGGEIVLPFPSVGATENAMLAATLADGETTIINGAREPEIICLQNFLNKAGAKISGAGGEVIHISGVKKLNPVEFRIDADRIAAATYMACAMATKGRLKLYGVCASHMNSPLSLFKQMGARLDVSEDIIEIEIKQRPNSIFASTQPYPGFPTDCLPVMTALASMAQGTSVFSENIFKNRFRHTDELAKLGANIHIFGKTCVIQGTEMLKGAMVDACDLRGGASMVIAGLGAAGQTVIENPCYLDRGYENLCGILSELGADIKREKIYEKEKS